MIKYKLHDCTLPLEDNIVIAHIVNNVGAYGAGFVAAVNRRFGTSVESPKWQYTQVIESFKKVEDGPDRVMGAVQVIGLDHKRNVRMAHLFAQDNYSKDLSIPFSVTDLSYCLFQLAEYCKDKGLSVQMPFIGAGIGGGDWENVIEPLIQTKLAKYVPVTVCVHDINAVPSTARSFIPLIEMQ